MTGRTFTASAWLAMISAIATLPMTYLAFMLEHRGDAVAAIMQGGLQVVGTVLFVVITLILKRFLNRLFLFHDTDKSIDLMVTANVVAGLLLLGGIFFPAMREGASLVGIILVILQGVAQLQFGYKLLTLPNNLGGMLKPFCFLNMASGFCVSSIVLILPGVVLGAIADLMLATIFFKVAQEMKEAEPGRTATR